MKKVEIPIVRIVGLLIGIFLLAGSAGAQSTTDSSEAMVFTKGLDQTDVRQNPNPAITLKVDQVPLEEALKQITGQAEMGLYYNAKLLPETKVSLFLKAVPLAEALRKVLEETSLKAVTSGRNITLRKKKETNSKPLPVATIQETITGTVTDAQSGETLPGVNILVKGTSTGTSTDSNGNFELTVESLQDTLVVSYIGYQTREVPINGRTEINVALQSQTIAGEELVVVGYGTQRKRNVTGAISTVTADEITQAPTSNIGNALSGEVPGLQTIQRSGAPGESAPEIYIRGVSSLGTGRSTPIFVLDGVIQRNARAIMQIDPSNIKSVSVLKDASATAVYGVQGANGVIVVETKRGKRGPTEISVNTSAGLQTPVKTPDFVDSYTYMRAYNEAAMNDGASRSDARYPPEVVEAVRTGKYPLIYPSIDLVNTFTKSVAFQSRTNINVSGGTEDVRYYVAAGYLKQDGFFKTFESDYDFNPTYDRYNFRSNLDIDVTPTTTISLTAGGRFSSRVRIRGVGRAEMWWKLYWTSPFGGAGVKDGKIINTGNYYIPGPKKNAIADVYGNGYNQDDRTTLNLNLSARQDLSDIIVDGLSLQLKGSYNIFNRKSIYRSGNVPVYTPFFKTDVDPSATGDSTIVFQKSGAKNPLGYSEDSGRDRSWYIETRLNYDQDFGPHSIEALLLYSQRKNYYPSQYTGIPNSYVSSVGRLNYSYENRYLAEFSMGYNGSENFARGQRFGFFPAVSAGWILTNEPYFPEISFLSFLKLRASYGIVGNDRGVNQRFLYLPDQYDANTGGYNFGYEVPANKPGAAEGALGNPNVTWEKAEKQNYGIDLRLFNDKLDLSFDYFYEYRSEILTRLNTVPDYVAANLPVVNVGEVENKGYEFEIEWQHTAGDFYYSIGGNVAFARNEIIFMDEVARNEPYLRRTGKPVGQNFGYVVERWYTEEDFKGHSDVTPVSRFTPEPGYPKYKDLNADGKINSDDQRALGYPEYPEYTFGADLSLSYKGFDFSMQWAGATHVSRELGISPFATPFGGNGQFNMMQYMWDGRWTPGSGQNAIFPKLTLQDRAAVATNSTIPMRDASYIRLKSAEIGYNLDSKLIGKLGLKNMRIYLNGYNLLTFSRMEVLDPEQSANAQEVEYPIMKVYNIGINIDF